jgi:hypothetical protein
MNDAPALRTESLGRASATKLLPFPKFLVSFLLASMLGEPASGRSDMENAACRTALSPLMAVGVVRHRGLESHAF